MTTILRFSDREPRQQVKRLAELERNLSEVSSWNEWKRAELEVQVYEAQLEAILSVHHQDGLSIDWRALAFALPPHAPSFYSTNHLRETLQNFAALKEGEGRQEKLQEMWKTDEADYYDRHARYQERFAEWQRLREVALRILGGDTTAYGEAVQILQPFSELAEMGSEIKIKAHDSKKVLCTLRINGQEIIPKEVKSLTASDKLSVKAMPKGRFHEIYQDYACGCCLRVGRELLAMLPVDHVLTTIQVSAPDSSTGNIADIPILSALLDRSTMESLNFSALDPSDSMQNFMTRGDVKISKKTGTFITAVPLSYEELSFPVASSEGVDSMLGRISQMRNRLRKNLKPGNQGVGLATTLI
jgi:hypothetical protein